MSSEDEQSHSSITTFDLLRHGECEGGQCYRGSIDVALTPEGYARMCESVGFNESFDPPSDPAFTPINNNVVNSTLRPWQTIITSPLRRCSVFATDLSAAYQLPLYLEDDFQEIHFGDWEGQLMDEVWKNQRSAVEQWFADPVRYAPPNGEKANVFSERVVHRFLSWAAQIQGQHVLLVTHGGVIRALLAHCLSMSLLDMTRFDVPYGCLSQIQVITNNNERYYRLVAHNMKPV